MKASCGAQYSIIPTKFTPLLISSIPLKAKKTNSSTVFVYLSYIIKSNSANIRDTIEMVVIIFLFFMTIHPHQLSSMLSETPRALFI